MTAVTTADSGVHAPPRHLAELVDLSGLLAGWCDRAEHNEGVLRDELLAIGSRLRVLGLDLLEDAALDPVISYASRLRQVEVKNVLFDERGPDVPGRMNSPSCTWRRAQLVQAEHDRFFHPDVVGLPRVQQVQHYALHLAKLSLYLQIASRDATAWTDWTSGRAADALVFGVKLATVANYRLPDSRLADRV